MNVFRLLIIFALTRVKKVHQFKDKLTSDQKLIEVKLLNVKIGCSYDVRSELPWSHVDSGRDMDRRIVHHLDTAEHSWLYNRSNTARYNDIQMQTDTADIDAILLSATSAYSFTALMRRSHVLHRKRRAPM